MSISLAIRTFIVSAVLALSSVVIMRATQVEPRPLREPFTQFPATIDQWEAYPAPDIDQTVLAALGVDEYVNRFYASGDRAVHLYIGYYATQQEGHTIHSPLNCLPGSGWMPLDRTRVTLPLASGDPSRRPFIANRIVMQKGVDRQIVLYWYQGHGRVEPSEYWNKIFLVLDSIRLNRSDAALVRVIAPDAGDSEESAASAEQTLIDFVNEMAPLLNRFLPL